jgi:RNA polymerase sigma-70 factor (ECF subfamily)
VAEDLAQEVLLVLHTKYGRLDRLEDLLPLSLQILRFKMVSLRRKAARRGEYGQLSADELPLEDRRPGPEDQAARRERVERLARALGQLGERCRKLFRLKLEGQTFAEIQALLGAGSINTVYTWDFRCRQQLLELLGGSWEAQP